MEALQKPHDAPLARELERLQQEFEVRNPELAEAMKVMNVSLSQYLTALGYLRLPAQPVGASDHTTPLPS